MGQAVTLASLETDTVRSQVQGLDGPQSDFKAGPGNSELVSKSKQGVGVQAQCQSLCRAGFHLQHCGGQAEGVHGSCGEGALLETGGVGVSNAQSLNSEEQRMEKTAQLGTIPP